MKTEDIERLVLLRQSGEISPAEAVELDREIARDPDAALLAGRLDRLAAAGRVSAEEHGDLPAFVRERILHESARLRVSARPRWGLILRLSAAAALVLLAGTLLLQSMLAPDGQALAGNTTSTHDDLMLARIVDDGLGADLDFLELGVKGALAPNTALETALEGEDAQLERMALELVSM